MKRKIITLLTILFFSMSIGICIYNTTTAPAIKQNIVTEPKENFALVTLLLSILDANKFMIGALVISLIALGIIKHKQKQIEFKEEE